MGFVQEVQDDYNLIQASLMDIKERDDSYHTGLINKPAAIEYN